MRRYGNKKRWMNEDNASQRDCKHRGEIRELAGGLASTESKWTRVLLQDRQSNERIKKREFTSTGTLQRTRSTPFWNERSDQVGIVIVVASLVPPPPSKHVLEHVPHASSGLIRFIVLHTQLNLSRIKGI